MDIINDSNITITEGKPLYDSYLAMPYFKEMKKSTWETKKDIIVIIEEGFAQNVKINISSI